MKFSYIAHTTLSVFLETLFKKIGISEQVYTVIVQSLVETSLRGVDSHGIQLVPHYIKAFEIGRINKNPIFQFIKKSSSVALVNADNGHGIHAGVYAMSEAVRMARDTGVGVVAVQHSTHFGAAALYSMIAAKNDMIGFSFTNTDSLVVPFGGKKAFLGTNPICFVAPVLGEEPFCLDMATSTTSWNNVLASKKENKILQTGWAFDVDGVETVHPEEAVYLQPLGGYKGYGLGLMVEILCSMLTGMEFGPFISKMYPLTNEKRNLGHFFMVLDIEKFQSVDVFKLRMKKMLDALRLYESAEGFSEVLVAGDKEKSSSKERSKKGIPVSSFLLKEFDVLAKEFYIKPLSSYL